MRFMFVDADTGMFKSIMDPTLTKPQDPAVTTAAAADLPLTATPDTHEPPPTSVPRDFFQELPA